MEITTLDDVYGNRSVASYMVVWIDDRPGSVERYVDHLQQHGWSVTVVRPDDPDLLTYVADSEAILLDLKWSALSARSAKSKKMRYRSAKRLAQYIATVQPNKPMVFVSNYFLTGEFDTIEKEVSPTAVTDRVDRQHESEAEGIASEIDRKLVEVINRSTMYESRIRGGEYSSSRIEQVFSVTPQVYEAMSEDERFELAREAGDLVSDLVDATFDGSSADWIVVGGVPPRVIRWGSRDEELDDALVDELSFRYDSVPFGFVRPETMI